jgi:transposase
MEQYAGLDVSLEPTSVCVVDGTGRIAREAKVASLKRYWLGLSRTAWR